MRGPIIFQGVKFWYNGRDYFRDSAGRLLHRVMWTELVGPIPRAHVVHHINGDMLDNRLENFRLMSFKEHMRLHGPRGFATLSHEWHVAHAKNIWANKKPVERTCLYCKGTYSTRSTTSKWCSTKCQTAARYHRVGKEKVANKDPGL